MRRLSVLALAASCLLPFFAPPAGAAVTLSSGGYGASVNLSATGTVQANATFGAANGTSDPAYDQTATVASVNHGAGLATNATNSASESLQTGVVNTRAMSDGISSNSAMATTTVNNVAFGLDNKLLSLLSLTGLLHLGADSLSSTTTAGINGAGLYATGGSAITGLTLTGSLLTTAIDGSTYANAAANTVLLSLSGLKVLLNEQLTTQSTTGIAMQTNAVHIALSDYALDGKLLSGDIVLGHSEAAVGGVPEPATWAFMIGGLGLVGASLRRNRAFSLFA